MIRSQGDWLFHEAETSGDWQSAAIALRQDVARLADEKAALVRALEDAWTLAGPLLPIEAVWTGDEGDDSLLDFASETDVYLPARPNGHRIAP